MLVRQFDIKGDEAVVTAEDKQRIGEASVQFKKENNFKHLASLKASANYIGIDIDTSDLDEEEQQKLQNFLEMM